ncbi:hypothetical protein HJC23_007723 [Cyclotella cryptica]|uniref:Uncharacterized protein n=1 Tax=Cyclotella cryptica TaxID=29204 RepID=A0ABD3PAC5_9STRA|eukprot:CCRYP_016391-RA/>CCRYP_016391-RA protein AED:0.47 eAED:0.47 QI:0/-1/0/1/-1/1/1/0/146
MNATRRTRIIAILPFAMCAIGTLVAFTNFMALQQYNAYHTLREEDLETLTDNTDAQSRLLKKLALSLVRAPVGQLGPENTQRKHLRYYNSLFFTSLEFGMNAKSLIEVGCASDPFIQYLDWVDRRTCVAPYYVKYGGEAMKTRTHS